MLGIRNWSIRARLLLAFVGVLVPYLVLAGVGVVAFEALWQSIRSIQEEVFEDLKRTVDLQVHQDRLVFSIKDYLRFGGPAERQQIEQHLTQLRGSLSRLEITPFQVEEERVLLEAVRENVAQIEAVSLAILSLPDPRRDRDTSAKMNAFVGLTDKVDVALNRLAQIHLEEIDEGIATSSRMIRRVSVAGILALLLSVAGAAVFALLFAAWLSRPIQAIARGSRRLAEGDLSQRVGASSGGELWEAAAAFNAMAERLERSAIENARLHDELERKVEERTTALKQAQVQLIQSGKLAAVGTLAAGVAHELNQPLMVIRGYAQELLADVRLADEEIREDLRRIEAQTTRMVAIINHLRDFSRQSKGKRQATDLNQVVTGALGFLGQQLKTQKIAVVQELASALPPVWADPLQLEQVLLNLITNARDAMEGIGTGTITIRTELASESRVALSVTDTGPGIPGELQARIFDPFFTTKEVGKGTGLGLSICHGIIEEHGGELTMESPVADGRGARFTISLPPSLRNDSKGDRA